MSDNIINFFLPKYPNIETLSGNKKIFNNFLVDSNFYDSIYRKKEFYENKLESRNISRKSR